MRGLIALGLAAVALATGGAFVVGSHGRARHGAAQVTARAAATTRLVDDGLGRTINQPAIVGAIKLPNPLPVAAAAYQQRSTRPGATVNRMVRR